MPGLEKATFLDKITVIQHQMSVLPQTDIPPTHRFIPGAYIREITIPKGTVAVSLTHKTRHASIMLSGEMSVVTPAGIRRIKAPQFEIGEAGSKRIGYAHEDSKWITVHVTSETDLAKIEETEFIDAKKEGVFDFETGMVKPEKQIEIDRADYARMLVDVGVTDDLVRRQSENAEDRINIDLSSLPVKISESSIEGRGIFSRTWLLKNSLIGPGRQGAKRTQLGRYTNHSCCPNAKMVRDSSHDIWLVALRNISPGEEITVNYRQAVLEAHGREALKCQE